MVSPFRGWSSASPRRPYTRVMHPYPALRASRPTATVGVDSPERLGSTLGVSPMPCAGAGGRLGVMLRTLLRRTLCAALLITAAAPVAGAEARSEQGVF